MNFNFLSISTWNSSKINRGDKSSEWEKNSIDIIDIFHTISMRDVYRQSYCSIKLIISARIQFHAMHSYLKIFLKQLEHIFTSVIHIKIYFIAIFVIACISFVIETWLLVRCALFCIVLAIQNVSILKP